LRNDIGTLDAIPSEWFWLQWCPRYLAVEGRCGATGAALPAAIAIEAEAGKSSGAIRVRRVACAHDCGLIINPDALRPEIRTGRRPMIDAANRTGPGDRRCVG
jgi:hypothetical protein